MSSGQAVVAMTLRLDREAVRLSALLLAAGIPAILLKGPALQAWLYPGESRAYGDVDLLVPDSLHDDALRLLARLGYADATPGSSSHETGPHARTLVGPDHTVVDLHLSLNTTHSTGDTLWEALREDARPMKLGTGEVQVCGPIAQLMIVVLHAAQHGEHEPKPLEDLRRASHVTDIGQLEAAAALAKELGAAQSFAAGVRLAPEWVRTAPHLASQPSDLLVRAKASSGHRTPGVLVLAGLRSGSAAEKLSIIARAIWPTNAYLRLTFGLSADATSARLARARLSRWAYQIRHLREARAEVGRLRKDA